MIRYHIGSLVAKVTVYALMKTASQEYTRVSALRLVIARHWAQKMDMIGYSGISDVKYSFLGLIHVLFWLEPPYDSIVADVAFLD